MVHYGNKPLRCDREAETKKGRRENAIRIVKMVEGKLAPLVLIATSTARRHWPNKH